MEGGEKQEGKIPVSSFNFNHSCQDPKYRCGVEEPIISEEEIASLTQKKQLHAELLVNVATLRQEKEDLEMVNIELNNKKNLANSDYTNSEKTRSIMLKEQHNSLKMSASLKDKILHTLQAEVADLAQQKGNKIPTKDELDNCFNCEHHQKIQCDQKHKHN